MSNIYKPDKDRSLSRLHCESVTASVENAAIAYQAPSLISAGAQARDIALLSTISNLLFALLLVKVPTTIKFGDSLKRAVIIIGFLGSMGWIPLIIVPLLIKDIPTTLLIILWVLNLVPSLMVGPLVDKWLSDLVPPNKVGRYLSIRAILSAATYLSFFYGMGYMLDRLGANTTGGFSILFLCAFAASMGTLLICLRLRVVVPFGERDQSGFGLSKFIREARDNNLGTFIIFTALIIFTTGISTAFFSVYMLNDLHFTYLTYTLVISVEYLARISISYLGGRWIDHAGPIRVIRYAAVIIPILPILWLFSSHVGYLIVVQVLSGAAWATFDLCTQSCLCRESPGEKRLHYIIYHRSIVTMAAAVGPLVGALLFTRIFPVFGNPILGIFLLSGVLRLLVVAIWLPRLKSREDVSQDCGPDEFGVVPGTFVLRPSAPARPTYHATYQDLWPVTVKANRRTDNLRNTPAYHPLNWQRETVRPATVKQNIRQDRLYENFKKRNIQRPVPERSLRQNIRSEQFCRVVTPGRFHESEAETTKTTARVSRLSDNIFRDIEYHKRWASRVPCST